MASEVLTEKRIWKEKGKIPLSVKIIVGEPLLIHIGKINNLRNLMIEN